MLESIALGIATGLDYLDSTLITGLCVVVMLLLFAAAMGGVLLRRGTAFYQSTPTLLTTLGILGTFLGIAIGLLDFDASHIEASIPLLLDGLKLAFSTSIVGILLSACLRLILVLGPARRDARSAQQRATNTAGDAPPTDTLSSAALLQRQVAIAQAQLSATEQLTEHLVQLGAHLTQTLTAQHERQLAALQQFSHELSANGSQQLIAALESVVRDFNANLTEQFGDNFRQLDAAVAKLLDWQAQYREHMESLGSQLDRATAGVRASETSLQALTQQATQISSHLQDQAATMLALRRETLELEAVLGGIAELRDKAQAAFPAIDERLRRMLESIEDAVLVALGTQQRLAQGGLVASQIGITESGFTQRANA